MANPTPYKPHFNYSGWEQDSPAEPKPGAEIDVDFQNIARSIDETIDALKDLRRSDGKLNNALVTFDALNPAVKAAIAGSEFDYEVIEDLLAKDANLQDLPDKAEAIENLGALGRDDNLSDLTNAAEARANLGTFASVTDVQNSHVPAVLESIRTFWRNAPGDGGGALLVEGTSSDPGAVQDADGKWWKVAEKIVTPQMFGAVGDGSTPDQTALEAVVNFALLTSSEIYWPDGDYLSTDNIPGFHDARHSGPGVIVRGGSRWHITPSAETVNEVHVSADFGVWSNDGLTPDHSVHNLQRAVDLIARWAPLTRGHWQITAAAGVYPRVRFPDENLAAAEPIRIVGEPVSVAAGHEVAILTSDISGEFQTGETLECRSSGATLTVNSIQNRLLFANVESGEPVFGEDIDGATSGASATIGYITPRPITIIRQSQTESAVGIFSRGTTLYVKDVLVEDYNGNSSSAGINVSAGADLYCDNVHVEDCYTGLSIQEWGKLDAKGGLINDCGFINSVTPAGQGVRFLFHCKANLGTRENGSVIGGPLFINNFTGVLAQENNIGHVDYCLFEDNSFALRVGINSRFNTGGSSFKRNTTVIQARNGSQVTPNGVFLGSGADANTRIYSIGSGSSSSTTDILTTNVADAIAERCIMRRVGDPFRVINATSAEDVYSLTAVAHVLRETYSSDMPAKAIRFRVLGRLVGTSGNKLFHLRINDSILAGLTFVDSDTGVFNVEGTISFEGPGSQVGYIQSIKHLSNVRTGAGAASFPLDSDTKFAITAYVQNSSDQIEVLGFEAFMSGI